MRERKQNPTVIYTCITRVYNGKLIWFDQICIITDSVMININVNVQCMCCNAVVFSNSAIKADRIHTNHVFSLSKQLATGNYELRTLLASFLQPAANWDRFGTKPTPGIFLNPEHPQKPLLAFKIRERNCFWLIAISYNNKTNLLIVSIATQTPLMRM